MSRPILILDDDRDLLALLRRAVEQMGYPVVTATDAPTALELSEQREPQLIIADLMLPRIDGEAFLEQYRRQWPQRRPCPVMLLTASAQREKVARRMEVQAALAKPFSLADLKEVVRELISDEQGAEPEGERHGHQG
ncbi:MAG: response regulator [Myxococcota bacterium]